MGLPLTTGITSQPVPGKSWNLFWKVWIPSLTRKYCLTFKRWVTESLFKYKNVKQYQNNLLTNNFQLVCSRQTFSLVFGATERFCISAIPWSCNDLTNSFFINSTTHKSLCKSAFSIRSVLPGQKRRHDLHEGSTLNDLCSFQQTKILLKPTESIWILTAIL